MNTSTERIFLESKRALIISRVVQDVYLLRNDLKLLSMRLSEVNDVNSRVVKLMSDKMQEIIYSCGYKRVTPDDQELFDIYYDRMNLPWAASACFLNMIVWGDTIPYYYKEYKEMIIAVCYDSNEGMLVGVPFIGNYRDEAVTQAFSIMKEDFRRLDIPIVIMDVSKWMLPYYEALTGETFDVDDDRDSMEYIYTSESLEAGMNKQDDRYRYRYFMRKYDYEALIITPDHKNELKEFMNNIWCVDKRCSECEFGCLRDSTELIVSAIDKLRADGIMVRVSGKTVGFCIVTRFKNYGIYQFKHAVNGYKGLNEYLLRECYEHFLKGVDIINYTEDCGIEGLRRYKMNLCEDYELSSRLTLTAK